MNAVLSGICSQDLDKKGVTAKQQNSAELDCLKGTLFSLSFILTETAQRGRGCFERQQ